jgi:hypothetical protein
MGQVLKEAPVIPIIESNEYAVRPYSFEPRKQLSE